MTNSEPKKEDWRTGTTVGTDNPDGHTDILSNKEWRERFDEKFLEMLQSLYGGAEMEYEAKKIIINFIQQLIKEEKLEMWQEFEQLNKIHKIELDAIAMKSIEDFIIWRDQRINEVKK